MVLLRNSDAFRVIKKSLIADYDIATLLNLYQPIVGFSAISLYLNLANETNSGKSLTHEYLYVKMNIAPGAFIKSRKMLEAVGLLKTKMINSNPDISFVYNLYAPKTPKDFFDDVILYGLLIKCVGEEQIENIKSLYKIDEEIEGEDISSSFKEMFHPNFEDAAFVQAINSHPAKGRNQANIMAEFNLETLFDELAKISQISSKAFSKKEMEQIARLATLYGINEITAASVIDSLYDESLPKGKRIDLDKINNIFQEETNYTYLNKRRRKNAAPHSVSSSSDIASKINACEKLSPKDFLSALQNGTQPAKSDLYLISDLSNKYHLNNAVINVIVDYVLSTNNNVLTKTYAEKIASSIVREGIDNASDAMEYLNKIHNKSARNLSRNNTTMKKEEKKDEENSEDVSWDDLLKELGYENND